MYVLFRVRAILLQCSKANRKLQRNPHSQQERASGMLSKATVGGSLLRGHSFINRTPHTAVNIEGKKQWAEIVKTLAASTGKAGMGNVRCLRVEDCPLEGQVLDVPASVWGGLMDNLLKLVVSGCRISAMHFTISGQHNTQALFPKLQQFNGSHNILAQVPQFLYQCGNLAKLDVSYNKIVKIDNRLAMLPNLRYINLLSNSVAQIGVGFCMWVLENQLGVEFQWHAGFVYGCVVQGQGLVEDGTKRTGTTVTESDYQANCEQVAAKPIMPSSLSSLYLQIPESVGNASLLKSVNPALLQTQIQTIVLSQNLLYLSTIESYVTEQMCDRYIEMCFKERKYASLDVLVNKRLRIQEKSKRESILKELRQENGQNGNVLGSEFKANKDKCKAVRKKIKMIEPRQDKTKRQLLKTARDDQFLSTNLLLPILMTFNLDNYSSIPLIYLQQLSKDDLIWILGQIQIINLRKSAAQIRQVLQSPIFRQIFNYIVASQSTFQEIMNSVHYRPGLKGMLLSGNLAFLEHYDFSNISILKSILRLQDFEIFRLFESKYSKFSEALFANIPRSFSFTSIDSSPHSPSQSPSIRQSIFCEDSQGTSWKYLLAPTSKLYKYAYKKSKKYIALQLEGTHNKNLHFQEYVPMQSFLVRNDVHDYDILQNYEEFQASFCHKDLKLRVRHTNREQNYSIAKRIYMQVIDQASTKVRNIGKSREKKRHELKNLNKTSFNCARAAYAQFQTIDPLMLSWNGSSCKQQSLGQVGNKTKLTSRSSIKVMIHNIQDTARKHEKQKQVKRKKNGIFVCKGMGESKQNKQNVQARKTVYLDLSQNRTISSVANTKSVRKQFESSRNNDGSSLPHNTSPINQIECSTFDI